ncbi:hypothetical protein TBCH5v1_2567 [Thermococcus barophilus]|uniref:Integrase SSV1 C-terminal domain-containing protein n=1 Tax=Thermococcus barophilus TaxID=55802 RepID=A0A0S1XFF8_THEBA|nr:hypothetical protein TBCH5v1_2567 [Thermococcus barophilus]
MDIPQEPNIFSEPITKKQPSKGFLLNDLWKEYKNKFLSWYLNKKYKGKTLDQLEKNQRKTVKAYISALDRLFSKFEIRNNLDIMEALKALNYGKWYANGLRNFLNFLFEIGLINMEDYERMKKAIQSKKAEAPSEEVFEKININEIKKAYKRAIEYVKTKSRIPNDPFPLFFKFLYYTGLRLDQAVRIFKNLKKSDIKFEGNIAYILTHEAKRGKKGTYIAIMPKHFGEELTENIRYVGNLPERIDKRFGKEGINFGAKLLRKFHYNFLRQNGVEKDIAEFIQGRSSVDVGSTYYLDKIRLAKEQYKKIADKFPKLD